MGENDRSDLQWAPPAPSPSAEPHAPARPVPSPETRELPQQPVWPAHTAAGDPVSAAPHTSGAPGQSPASGFDQSGFEQHGTQPFGSPQHGNAPHGSPQHGDGVHGNGPFGIGPQQNGPQQNGPYGNQPFGSGPYGTGFAPPGGPGIGTQEAPQRGGKAARGVLMAAGVLVLMVGSGAVGGLVADRDDRDAAPARTVTITAPPPLDRASVADVAARVTPSVVHISTSQGEGSGVILTADGTIVTNNHVVESATGNTVTVRFSDGRTAQATIAGTDPVGDVAVIKAQGVSGLTAAKFGDSDVARVGDTVLAIGSPLGLQGSVSEGIISALHRTIDAEPGADGRAHSIGDAIQTDAAINPGNSGGALVNLNGEVIGINTAIATAGQNNGSIGLGFAIAGNRVRSAVDQLLAGGKVSHPYLGVSLGDGSGGALVADVVANGPAAAAGMQRGDLVTKAGSRTVTDSAGLVGVVQTAKAGDKLELTVVRDGSPRQITVTLAETP